MVPNLTSNGCNRSIIPEELNALPNLRFLRVKGIDFSGDFENLVSKLCWLSWKVTHNKFYAKNFHFVSLVVLDLSRSNIENDWGGWSQFQMTKKLKVLDLTSCMKLTSSPDFSNFMSLEILILAGCVKLITIDCSISKLELLKTLNIKGCPLLRKLPALHSLTQIVRDRDTRLIERLQMRQQERFLRHSGGRICGGALDATTVPRVRACLQLLRTKRRGKEKKMLLEALDNLKFWSNITLGVDPEISQSFQSLLIRLFHEKREVREKYSGSPQSPVHMPGL
ncbi:disease resistance protein RPP4-like [Eucalyptus grandis]|uniref:disease resistance protein RPP4-like n=1 Tax=Eucalyptus grandis TaxID=71139 RepID=UPI00192E78DA|nr:disease resistance protein RPP4-like [Eucalyptus grandis]